MANLANPFNLLGDDDAEDPSQLIAAHQKPVVDVTTKKGEKTKGGKDSSQVQPKKPALLPTKPPPPTQAVREARNDAGRGGSRGGGRGRGRGGRGFSRDSFNENSFGSAGGPVAEEGETGKPSDRSFERRGPRGPYRGGRRGGFRNGDTDEGERPRRAFERHSGTGRGYEMKREGAGRGNWGTPTDEIAQVTEEVVNEADKPLGDEKPAGEEAVEDVTKESANESEEKEPENKEMTLEEYEKVLEEKRKALQALKTAEERKVDTKEFESMQLLSSKKENDEVFIKLGSEKDKRKEAAEKDEKAKKSLSINEFLKPTEGEGFYRPGGRGRGRGRGSRGYGDRYSGNMAAPSIEDPGQFPTLGAK